MKKHPIVIVIFIYCALCIGIMVTRWLLTGNIPNVGLYDFLQSIESTFNSQLMQKINSGLQWLKDSTASIPVVGSITTLLVFLLSGIPTIIAFLWATLRIAIGI